MIESPGGPRSPSSTVSALEDSYGTNSGYIPSAEKAPPSVNKLPSLRKKDASPVSAARKALFIEDAELQAKQDSSVGADEVKGLSTDGTGVMNQFPAKVPTDLNAASESTKKSEIAEGKLKLIIARDATTETLKEAPSQETVPVPTATTPTEPEIDHKRKPKSGSGALSKKNKP